MGMAGGSQSNSQYVAGMTGAGGAQGQTGHGDGASRMLSAETINDKQQKKTITDIL